MFSSEFWTRGSDIIFLYIFLDIFIEIEMNFILNRVVCFAIFTSSLLQRSHQSYQDADECDIKIHYVILRIIAPMPVMRASKCVKENMKNTPNVISTRSLRVSMKNVFPRSMFATGEEIAWMAAMRTSICVKRWT